MAAGDLYDCAEAAVGKASHWLVEYHRSREADKHLNLALAVDELSTAMAAIQSLRAKELP